MRRTDLFYETAAAGGLTDAARVHRGESHGTRYLDAVVPEGIKEAAPGHYVTVFTETGNAADCLTGLLKDFLVDGSVLVAGLGNENVCSDSLGVRALCYVPATAHLSGHSDFGDLGLRRVFVRETGVTGRTGIESSESISCTAGCVGAAEVIVIDSLACADIGRLCNTIQVTDTGIAPGSGVGNDRKAINRETAGVPVVAIGVPTVIDLDSITGSEKTHGLMVTPRSIDAEIRRLSEIIGISVSRALNPTLSEAEIRSLMI